VYLFSPVAQEEEQYIDTQPPTLESSKPEEEHYVEVEPPTTECSKPEEVYEHYVDVEPPTSGMFLEHILKKCGMYVVLLL
jgi:hypothetical protein